MPTIADQLALGVHHHRAGRLQDAEEVYRQVLAVDAHQPHALHLLGLIAHQMGRHDIAIELIGRAIRSDGNVSAFHSNLGAAYHALHKYPEAITCYRHALRIQPNDADVFQNLGLALVAQDHVSEGIACYQHAAQLKPESASIYSALGVALRKLGRVEEAIAAHRQALRLDPYAAEAHNDLGCALTYQAESIACFQEAVRIKPDYAEAHNNLGIVFRYLGQISEARACYEAVVRLRPEIPMARWNLCVLKLLEGDFLPAWPDFEYRWLVAGAAPRYDSTPRWDGAALADKTVLLYAEQGLGDTLQFIRFAPLVKRRVGKVLLECQPVLAGLLRGVEGVDRLITQGEPVGPFDVQLPLLSLAGVLGTTVATIPANIPYVRANPALVERWRQELQSVPGFKIGIAWQGSTLHREDVLRSCPLMEFAPLAALDGVTLVSLQVGTGTAQLAAAPFRVLDLGSRFDPHAMDDLAAVLMNLDLVVTVDTAVVHLAGALGVPVWVALPFVPDWRWLLERSDSPWYPSLRLFRQGRHGDWTELFERIGADVRRLMET